MNDKTTLNKRVTIPHNVADAIETLKYGHIPFDNRRIIRVAQSTKFIGPTAEDLRSIPFDTLLAALVNGYEREKTPEEIAHDRLRSGYVEAKSAYRSYTESIAPVKAARCEGFADGIKFALNELGVKISGVNAPEGVNA